MCSYARLRGLYRGLRAVVRDGVPGDVVECGTARGGSAALLSLAARDLDDSRRVWAFDTFEGLPPPTAHDPDYDAAMWYVGSCRGEIDEVAELMTRLGVRDRVTLVKGLFQDTLLSADVPSIALLHLDGDWYDSVKCCLDQLYDRVSPGGVIQIDDFGQWEGARKATLDFFSQRALKVRLVYLDGTGRQFRKPPAPGRGD
jgi:predicted O-methyltransferase YrrM